MGGSLVLLLLGQELLLPHAWPWLPSSLNLASPAQWLELLWGCGPRLLCTAQLPDCVFQLQVLIYYTLDEP